VFEDEFLEQKIEMVICHLCRNNINFALLTSSNMVREAKGGIKEENKNKRKKERKSINAKTEDEINEKEFETEGCGS
jgi:hypothetical protein